MGVVGIGIDATDIPRVAEALARFGDRFLQRVFTAGEIAYCTRHRNPAPHLAGRFAAKEAAMKALGTGHACGVSWHDVEVARDDGPPRLLLHGAAADHAARLQVVRVLLTITHAEALAVAQVVLISRESGVGSRESGGRS
jgi:holo-[acyl-carrier protein] synthase